MCIKMKFRNLFSKGQSGGKHRELDGVQLEKLDETADLVRKEDWVKAAQNVAKKAVEPGIKPPEKLKYASQVFTFLAFAFSDSQNPNRAETDKLAQTIFPESDPILEKAKRNSYDDVKLKLTDTSHSIDVGKIRERDNRIKLIKHQFGIHT